MTSKPNIIFIVMDALRAKNLGCYGYFRNTSPNIDNLAGNGVLFKNVFSSNNSTEKSFLSILSSRHILLGKSKELLLTKDEISSFFNSGGTFLQEILKKQGYKTYCLKELHGWQKRGFDYYLEENIKKPVKINSLMSLKNNPKIRKILREITHRIPSKRIASNIKARYGRLRSEEITKKVIEILKKTKKKENFFMWVDYNDTHRPYNAKQFTNKFESNKKSPNFFKEISKENYDPKLIQFFRGAFNKYETIEDIISRYDGAIFYDDFLIGQVIDILKKRKLIKNTIIFFFSDHGESFDEHGIYFDHHGLYDISERVPLIIHGEGMPKGKKINGLIQHEDFVPTILELVGLPYNTDLFDGKSLLPLIKGKKKKVRDLIFIEEGDKVNKKSIRTKEYKYIEANSKEDAFCTACNKIHGGLLELYDVKKDPDEKENLVKKNLDLLEKMKAMLDKHIKEMKVVNERRRIKENLSKIKSIPKS